MFHPLTYTCPLFSQFTLNIIVTVLCIATISACICMVIGCTVFIGWQLGSNEVLIIFDTTTLMYKSVLYNYSALSSGRSSWDGSWDRTRSLYYTILLTYSTTLDYTIQLDMAWSWTPMR